jgi:hypothetical protein
MFRPTITLLLIASLPNAGIPSVVCMGLCRVPATKNAPLSESCCTVHASKLPDASVSEPARPERECCCCAEAADGRLGSAVQGEIEGVCRTNCSCCIVHTPLTSVLPKGAIESEIRFVLSLLKATHFLATVELPEFAQTNFVPSEPGSPPRSSDIPLNVRLCIWTV